MATKQYNFKAITVVPTAKVGLALVWSPRAPLLCLKKRASAPSHVVSNNAPAALVLRLVVA